ncbi:MAG: NAD-glutamate dehydrogenase [Thermomonas sp.]|uniref:NAD-glutamate dehydrogenase n=1 Tax=Thermomonas sp. TaxID=1971895 RepID=UPI001ECBA7E5|nr:NAD-glutamate dehydrogenase domain-containing protein [Thermomonas sp.]MBV2210313.1 NAD-glutamate dehydrogenase [Thermomonas sp.]
MNKSVDSRNVDLKPVLDALAKRVGKAGQEQAIAFATAFYQRLDAEELASRSIDEWADLAADTLEFVATRKRGKANVRLTNPALETSSSSHTVLQIVNDDMPFLVDSVSMALADMGVGVHVLGHPIVRFTRDKSGKITAVGSGDAESVMYIEIDRQQKSELATVKAGVNKVLEDVRAIVADWEPMRAQMREVAEELSTRKLPVTEAGRKEAQEFLRWAADDHFTFFGYREYQVGKQGKDEVLASVSGSGLGLLRDDSESKPRSIKSLAAHTMPQSGAVDALILTKTNARATVHRPGYMDYIGVLSFDSKGRAVSEQRFVGLYTSSAYTRRPWDIPLVRERHNYVMDRSGLDPNGHSGKALRHILETLPRDELFQANEEELFKTCMGILGLQERVRSKLFLRRDRYGRYYSVLTYIPRERMSTQIRHRIEAMLRETLGGVRVDTNVQIGDSPLAQMHTMVRLDAGNTATAVDITALESKLALIVRDWRDELREQLVANHGEEQGLKLAARYASALPAGYIEEVSPEVAADDVEHIDSMHTPADMCLKLYRTSAMQHERLRFKMFRYGAPLVLSEALPVLENMGLKVLSEHVFEVTLDDESIFIQDFEVMSQIDQFGFESMDVEAVRGAFEGAFEQVLRGNSENDGFNRLVLSAKLDWQQVAMLRAYSKYLLQTGVPFSQSYMEATLTRYPLLARLLVELFEARFHPETGKENAAMIKQGVEHFTAQLTALTDGDEAALTLLKPLLAARSGKREQQIEAAHNALKSLLDRVASLDEDRILRSFIGVIDATLRTNYYIDYADGLRKDGGPADYLAFKFDTALVPDLPKPRPYREIWVCGPRVEGTHLRFGPVARGGLRWSDRREDFRTEVLGLVKAQMVKNTVIVPVGSKGGFYPKQLPNPAVDRDAWLAEGIACYKRFINGLLDITDNLSVEGKVLPPPRVVRHDGDDPYLVVAADKGTASFSDIANGIAQAHSYWLDDAFASGGSAGYSHKGMGITARGAWESVKHHFGALGRNCQKDDFTCVGIGDMSGDVFGNGMLLSTHTRVLCAFDHRHIFLDPNPDAAVSFKERQRLFKLPRSSWADYDTKLISKGGGVYARSLKSIDITPEVRAALGIADDVQHLTPTEFISAALKAPVDLLYNGGIGTYIKASSETNAEVGDRANNGLRVNGADLRCKIIGEGGNLGMTQLGRIEAAQAGVLLNTDFIDNSAGVDTSDHEVNIKILLNGEVQKKKLKLADRNKLLASMTDEVAKLVLNDNYRQNQALSLMERMNVSRLGSKMHFINTLESQGLLDRQIEFLPTDAQIAERKLRGQGLTRPELAILLSYSKLVAFPQLLDSDIPEDPYLSKELVRYFPEPLQAKYAKVMDGHRLKREIIATAVTNSTINRMGATFLMRMQEDSGRSIGEIARAYTITRETLDARELWAQIDTLDGKVGEGVQVDALMVIWELQRSFTRWLLSRPGAVPAITTAVERYHDGFRDIRAGDGIISDAQRPEYEANRKAWRSKGLSAALADQLAALPYLESSPDIIELARERKLRPTDVAKVYFRLGEALRAPWLRAQIEALKVEGRWHAVARGVLRDELFAQLRTLTGQALSMPGKDADAKVQAWLSRDDSSLRFTLAMLTELASHKTLDYPTASVAVQRVAQLASRG